MFSDDFLNFNPGDENSALNLLQDTSTEGTNNVAEPSHSTVAIFQVPEITDFSLSKNVSPSVVIRSSTNTRQQVIDQNKCTKAVRRKFPGPAGLLPDKPPRSFNDSLLIPEKIKKSIDEKGEEPILCSQASESAFTDPPFKKLRTDFEIDLESPLNSFTIDWVKRKALSKGLQGRKIPFLAVILQSVDCSSADPVITLRDPTGELHGTLHRDVWKEMEDQFRPGAAIALKEVGVLSTGVSRRQIVLNVTKNNIVVIYCPCNESGVTVKNVQSTTLCDILRSITDWQANAAHSTPPQNFDLLSSTDNAALNLFPTISAPSKNTSIQGSGSFKQKYSVSGSNTMNPSRVPFTKGTELPADESVNAKFDLFMDDIDFSDLEEKIVSQITSSSTNSPPKTIKNTDVSRTTSLEETPSQNFLHSSNLNNPIHSTSMTLSQAETSMLDEVLSGVDLDDF